MDKYIGRLLDNRYEILEVIGIGGMAVVYKARCHRLNRVVAVKILKDDFLEDEEFRNRFHAESQAVAMLGHPNIVSVYDVSTSEDADYIVMELIEGITLKQYMEKKGVLNWKETLHFAIQIAKALEHAHSRGIVHRDIKPHNIMVLKNGSVKVMDFGIARVMSQGNTLTKEALGSVHYISPEQAKGGRVDNRSDIYSLGVVMYEMMTGRPPYSGDSPVAVAIQHINGGADYPSTLNPNIPGGLEQIIMKAMGHTPEERYNTATEMLRDMDEFRKNPAILFDGSAPATDAVLEFVRPVVVQPVREQVTASEERMRRHQEQKRQQTPAKRRASQPEEGNGQRANIVTAAIVACSLVAVVAIGIVLLWIFNGGSIFGQQRIEVPKLVGESYATLSTYSGLEIQMEEELHHSTYKEGEIIEQNPKAGTKVPKGTVVYVKVSLGKPPRVITMYDLSTYTETRATAFLNSQNLNLVILPIPEASEEVQEGCVIRTEPAAGGVLTPGQTVKLWVSTGPQIKTGYMPNVVGMHIDRAINVIKASGFHKYRIEMVESDEDKDVVVNQSEAKNTKVDISKEIVLEVSKGPAPAPTPPVETKPQPVTKQIAFALPQAVTEENYVVTIKNGSYTVAEVTVAVGGQSVTATVTGTGTQTFSFYHGDSLLGSEEVVFSADE